MKLPKGIRSVARPTMKNHRGRTWDKCDVILPDGVKVDGYLDTTWSSYFYFVVDDVWRRADIAEFENGRLGILVMDLREQRGT